MRQLLLWDAVVSVLSGRPDEKASEPPKAPPTPAEPAGTPPHVEAGTWLRTGPGTPRRSGLNTALVDTAPDPRAVDAAESGATASADGRPSAADTVRQGPSRPHDSALADNPQPHASVAQAPVVEFVRHPRARRYLIRVRLDGSVRVTIPRGGSKRDAAAFYEQQRGWVAEHQRRVATVRASIPQDLPTAEQQALRARARHELPERLLALARVAGVTVRTVSVRNQRHRWGSCSTSGLICLNWRLITMPDWVRDYVLYHELMHLKRMDHSPAFWAHVESVCPNYRAARRWLRRHALAPHTADAHRDVDGLSGASSSAEDDDIEDC